MNLRKTIAAAGLAAAAMTGMASAAPTIIYVCGSTAYRAPVTCAIFNELSNNGANTVYAAGNQGSGNAITKAQSAILANGTVNYSGGAYASGPGAATVIVETNWTGSLAGTVDVAVQNAALQFPDPTDSGMESAVNSGTVAISGTPASYTDTANLPAFVAPGNTGANVITHAPQVAMSDAFSSTVVSALAGVKVKSGQNVGGATNQAQLQTAISNAGLVEAGSSSSIVGAGTASGYLGIVPFEWVLGKTGLTSAPFNNITQQTAAYLLKNGATPVTMFATNNTAATPVANSAADFIYLVGRNEDSGTRIESLAEPQLGFAVSPVQFLVDFTVENSTDATTDLPTPQYGTYIGGNGFIINAAQKWPASSYLNTEVNLYWQNSGHSGYPGGGDVAAVLGSTPAANGAATGITFSSGQPSQNTGLAYFVGYLGTADAGGQGTTTVSGGTALTYNGVACSQANVLDGSYSFWCYEHMYYLPSTSSATIVGTTAGNFMDSVANDIATSYAVYNSSGVSNAGVKAAGILLPAVGTAGSVVRTIEGGNYTSLNY